MILYNTTFILEASASPDFLTEWAKALYIPAALASPGIRSHTFALIATPGNDETRSYAIQFMADDEAAVAVWEESAARFRTELEKHYGHGHVVWFSTYMDVLSHS